MKWLALCLCLMPLSAGAEEHPLLAALLETLARPDLSAPDLVAGMQAAGLVVEAEVSFTAEGSAEPSEDPFYYHLTGGAGTMGDQGATAFFECSRIGTSLLPKLPSNEASAKITTDGLRVVQRRETVDFAPGAVAQLSCDVGLMPFYGTVLPTDAQVIEMLQARFDVLAVVKEPPPTEAPETGSNWVLYPPLSATSGNPATGLTMITLSNKDPMVPGRASRGIYSQLPGNARHALGLVSHLAAAGN